MSPYNTPRFAVLWSVCLRTCTPDGRSGVHNVIVSATDAAEAARLAWHHAHTPRAGHNRRGAAIISRPDELHATAVPIRQGLLGWPVYLLTKEAT